MALTKKDLAAIQELIHKNNQAIFSAVFEYIEHHFSDVARKSDISHLPTKQEFYAMEDKLLSEVVAERQENAIQQHQLNRLDKRVTKLEKAVLGN